MEARSGGAPEGPARWVVGRSPDCDVVLNHAHVSGVHAVVERDGSGRWFVEDHGSTNGTFVNSLEGRIRRSEVADDDIVFFSRRYSMPARLLKGRLLGGMREEEAGARCDGARDVVRIGRAPDNDIVLDRFDVSRYHAEIRVLPGGRRILKDLGSLAGTYVNDRLLRGGEVEIGKEDRIEIGGMQVSCGFDAAEGAGAGRVGVDRRGIYVRSEGLGFSVRAAGGARALITDFDLAIYPGEFIGLMGPSGCGKSTLINLLIGRLMPGAGVVEYNGCDLSSNAERFGPQIGYVPQDDILHPELTVREALYYSARLKLPREIGDGEIGRKIDKLCERLGLYRPGTADDVRETLVGSPDRRGISGGQRKRVNLAIELLTDPQILFLDEPTSGLSSKDTRTVMELLRGIASERGIPVIITIHQPSVRVFSMLDKVIFMKAGRLCYFGPAFPDSVEYFEPGEDAAHAGADAVLERLEDAAGEEYARRYRESAHYRASIRDRWGRMARGEAAGSGATASGGPPPWAQFYHLLRRGALCKARDLGSLAVLQAQAPLVALVMVLVFNDAMARDRASVAFLLGFVSLWFGVNNSSREIVGELAIVRRERRSGLSPLAYVGSKAAIQAAVTFGQCAILAMVVAAAMPGLGLPFLPGILACWVTSLAGIGIGLAISAVSRSQVAATVAVPLVLIPIILLGGLIKPHLELNESPLMGFLSDLLPAQWAFEALAAVSNVQGFFREPSFGLGMAVLLGTGLAFGGICWQRVRRL